MLEMARRQCDTDGSCQMHSAASPFCLAAGAQVTAGLRLLISMHCQLKADMPTCTPLCEALLSTLAGLFYCLLTADKGHWTFASAAGVNTESEAVMMCQSEQTPVW